MIQAIFYHPLQQIPFLLSSFVFLHQRISSTPPWLSKVPLVPAIADSIPERSVWVDFSWFPFLE